MTATTLDPDLFDSLWPEPVFPECYSVSRPRLNAVRDAAAAARAPEGYVDEAVHLHAAYDHAIGWALQYGIKVFYVSAYSGKTQMLALGDLRDAIRAHEESTGVAEEYRHAVMLAKSRREAIKRYGR